MKYTIVTKLERPAKKGGGDRYQAVASAAATDEGSTVNIGEFMVYLPQSISRREGKPFSVLTLTINDVQGRVAA